MTESGFISAKFADDFAVTNDMGSDMISHCVWSQWSQVDMRMHVLVVSGFEEKNG